MQSSEGTNRPLPMSVLNINDLPDETLLGVLQCLPPHELLTAELVCQRWRGVATDHGNVLWRPLFDSSPYSRWWLPFRPSHDFTTLKESMESKQQKNNKKVIDYKWEYLIKSRCTERWLKFASFRRVSRGLRDHGDDYGGVVKWSRNETAAGGLGPDRIAIRAVLVGGGSVGCHTLSSALGKLFPGACVSLDQGMDVLTNPLSRVQLVITRDEEVEAEALLAYRREVAGTPFTFGPLPLEVELEGRCELVRNELFESARPTVVLAAFSLENFRSFNELRDKVLPAVRTRFNDLPVLVVGTKSDTRHPSALDSFFHVSGAGPDYQQGVALAYELGAKDYVECSILTREGLGSVLGATAELGVRHMLQFFARTDLESRPTGLRWAGEEDDQTEVHETIRCNGCGVAPVVGNCYKCDTCPDYHLCQTCFQGKTHNPDHTFKLWHTKKRRLIKRSFTEDEEGEDEGEAGKAEASEETAPLADLMEAAEAQGRNEAAAEEVRREKEEIKKKGSESFKKTGLGDSWKESVEDIFRMFSKSPESKGAKRKRASPPDDTVVSATTSASSSPPPSSSPAAVKKARTDSSEEK
ncbi:zinc finger, zz type domain containing protein [Acanthamoeba castellanii str. Neff]|uniref:Zinc finger, zz type domain containing protein n=1 Tax=Acanthamoeba castellanii (strain ATCC 30010 / Neff) TaxID=1257118 RepID=L8H9B9_ACACF|nr:zinc finger, zz type domain containing protein [Acanthamoeba castellanii str. Neff]ELR21031.1 zinc finger, zz type domain containing protein [Acanthamoeba castellanii str. Neff]